MADGLLRDLPRDFPSFFERFGSDGQCRVYLVRARWPEGFGCEGCGHGEAWSHKKRLIEECRACGKQHSILAGTIFEQTKPGLAKWFLAIYLVTSSKGGISVLELQRHLGFGSYQAALRGLLAALPSGIGSKGSWPSMELAAQDPQGHGAAGTRALEWPHRGR